MNTVRLGFVAAALVASAAAHAGSISSASDASLTGANVLTFESAATGNFQSQNYGGVSISALPGNGTQLFTVSSLFAGNYNTRGSLNLTNQGREFSALRFDFTTAVSAFGFLFGASDMNWTLSAYDATNHLLGSRSIAPTFASNAGDFFGLSGLNGASYATLVQSGTGVDYVFVDNLTYKTAVVAAVPEPGTYALLLAGMAVVAGVARRRKAD